MVHIVQEGPTRRPAGYAALEERYGLDVIPNWHRSVVTTSGVHRVESREGVVEEVYPRAYWPGETAGDHLEFALKYDGVNLAILAALFRKLPGREVLEYVRSRPTGKYARRIWYLYEFLTGERLPLEDVTQGNYVKLLEPERYHVVVPGRRVRRQRVHDNLLGDRRFCPVVRRTALLRELEASDFAARCEGVVSAYPAVLLRRALGYLYTRETKSSFQIERIQATATRTERFVALLQLAEQEDFCDKARLVELQNRIVDPRFRDLEYRRTQSYVGETIAWHGERVHYACPKPEDLEELMGGLLHAHRRMEAGKVPAVVHAAVVSYGFVFLHPFEDGNGRIHRFLIHNILARRGLTPEGVMFPISASMLRRSADYDASLEAFSRPLMALVEYSLDEEGRMTVHNDTVDWYRYMDLTAQVEALYRFVEQTIEVELAQELEFLANYDETRQAIQEIVDMPDRKVDLFIRFCLQNNGRLSARKRASHFSMLSDEEVERMEEAVRAAYETGASRGGGG